MWVKAALAAVLSAAAAPFWAVFRSGGRVPGAALRAVFRLSKNKADAQDESKFPQKPKSLASLGWLLDAPAGAVVRENKKRRGYACGVVGLPTKKDGRHSRLRRTRRALCLNEHFCKI